MQSSAFGSYSVRTLPAWNSLSGSTRSRVRRFRKVPSCSVSAREPVPFEKIYQPTRLLLTGTSSRNFLTLIERRSSAFAARIDFAALFCNALDSCSASVGFAKSSPGHEADDMASPTFLRKMPGNYPRSDYLRVTPKSRAMRCTRIPPDG